MKLEYVAVYENISDKFDNGHCLIKVKVMWDFSVYHITNCFNLATLEFDSVQGRRGSYFEAQVISLRTC